MMYCLNFCRVIALHGTRVNVGLPKLAYRFQSRFVPLEQFRHKNYRVVVITPIIIIVIIIRISSTLAFKAWTLDKCAPGTTKFPLYPLGKKFGIDLGAVHIIKNIEIYGCFVMT